MSARLSVLALATAAAFALGCGGIWQQAMSDTIRQQATELRAMLTNVTASPEKDEMAAMIDGLEAEAASGRVGVVDVASFRVEVEDAVYDGMIDAAEGAEAKTLYDSMLTQ